MSKDSIFETNEYTQPNSEEVVETETDGFEISETTTTTNVDFVTTPKKDDITTDKIKSPIKNRHFSDAFCDPESKEYSVVKKTSTDKIKCTTTFNAHVKQTQWQKVRIF